MTNLNSIPSEGLIATAPLHLADPEASAVINILEGARRSDRDPDVELAVVIADLTFVSDEGIQSALASLVADADPN